MRELKFSVLLCLLFVVGTHYKSFSACPFTITITQTNVSCLGGTNGTATAAASGGTAPYTYSWNTTPLQSSATATGLAAGTYTVTVRDANFCITTGTVTITQPSALTTSTSSSNNNCNNNNNGVVSVSASGGTNPYTYVWRDSANNVVGTTANTNGLSPGWYKVTVTDSKGCTAIDSASVAQPPKPNLAITKTNVSCYGGSNGTATVTITGGSGGTPNVSWSTSPTQNGNTATGLPAGKYYVTVTVSGCTTIDSVIITQPATLFGVTATKTDVSCFGGTNGMATAIGTGGDMPYTYSWNTSPVQTTAIATNLPAGTYTVTATDSNNCVKTTTVTVTQPAAALSVTASKTNVTCNGGGNGTAAITATGGTAPYTYSWNSTPVQATANAINLPAGIYTATVTDAKGCICTGSVTITQPTSLTATATKTDVSCNGGSNGTATVNATGGTTPYTYSWNTTPIQPSATATNLATGVYTATITDALGCITTANATVAQPPVLTATSSKTDVSCNGGSNGTATVAATGGTTPYTYSWNTTPVQTTATASNLAAGTYTATVTDSLGCTTTASAIVVQPAVLAATASKTDVSCNGGNNGTTTVSTSGGTAPYIYSWNTMPAQTTPTATSLPAGTYTATVTDALGCTTTTGATVIEPPVLTATATKTDVSCNGGNNGTATVTASGGTIPYTYSWNTTPIQATATASNLTAGSYTATVTDVLGCSTTASATVAQPSVLTASATKTDVSCNGGSNGTATVSANGGTAPYLYSWNTTPIQATVTASNLTAGSYTATVTDALGCTTTASVTIAQPPVLTATATKTDVSCNGGSNGAATVNTSGGTAPYTYSWNTTPVQTTSTATSLPAGTYTATVSDALGCTTTASATVAQPIVLTASATKTDVSCNSGNNGTTTVSATGGTAPYTYSWNTTPVQTTATASNLPAGTYTATVTDALGCTTTASIAVNEPLVLSATTTKTNVGCSGASTGTATAVVTGGTVPYTYNWNTIPAQTGITAINLQAGIYNVTVTDSLNCSTSATVTITQSPQLIVSTTKTDLNCYGDTNGTATAVVTGGTQPYSYSWNTTPVQASVVATNLVAGTYTVTVTDSNGCTIIAGATLNQPPLLTSSVTHTNVNCFSGNNGSATLAVTGGTQPYTYSWSSIPAQTSATAVNLIAGNYSGTVTDAKGCQSTSAVTITEPALLTTSVSKTDVSCFNGNNGSATIAVNGGTAPYTYSWNTIPVQTTATASNLSAGSYTVTVTDALNCVSTATVVIDQPTQLTIATNKTDVYCHSGNNGTATVNATGGVLPYTYSWSTMPVQNTPAAGNLAAGIYTITVADSNNCSATASVTINQPALLSAVMTKTDVSCFSGSDGTAAVVVTGGTTPYTYNWNTTPVQTTNSLAGLIAGNYLVIVTDALGCTDSASITINQPALLVVAATKTDASCHGGSDGTAIATGSGGTTPYTYSWNTSPVQTGSIATGLTAGTYVTTLTDAKGCIATDTTVITNPAPIPAPVTKTDVSCFGGSNGTAAAVMPGGIAPFTYYWNSTPVQTTATATNLAAGTYATTVMDSKGCIATGSITIDQPSLLVVTTSQSDAACNGSGSGAATANVTGGVAPYTYSWNTTPVQTTATATNLTAGTFTVTVTDSNNCVATANTTIGQPAPLAATTTKTDVSCYNDSDGAATVIATGGTAPHTYSWNTTPVQTAATASNLPAGIYTVTVKDANNCSVTSTVTIGQPTLLMTATTKIDVSCNGGSDGATAVYVIGGTAPYTYNWNTTPVKTTSIITALFASTYHVTVTDANGCTKTDSVVVNHPTPLPAMATKTDVSCFGGNNGTATVFASGGTAPYSYSWNTTPVKTTTAVTGLTAGNYTATVTDAHGCISTATVIVGQPQQLTATTAETDARCFASNDGTATVSVMGGVPPYAYVWNTTPGQTNHMATGLTSGIYTVAVTDSNNCSTTAIAIIGQPAQLTASAVQSDVSCKNGNDGTATVTVAGGTAPYSYSWNTTPVQTTATATGLTEGTYTVTITDAQNCVKTVNVVVTEPDLLVATATNTDVSCNSGNNATASVTVSGGTMPYSYSWNTTPVATAPNVSGLSAGTYMISVTDAKGCSSTDTVTIGQPNALTATAAATDVSCFNGSNGTATVNSSGGILPYSYSWSTTPAQTTATATNLPAGSYTITVTDSQNCVVTATVVVNQPAQLNASVNVSHVSCSGGNNGTATVTANGGVAPYTYSWNTIPVQSATTALGLIAGTYAVTVTDSNGCTVTANGMVTQPAILTAAINKTDVSCKGGSNSSATVTATGGTVPYTYSWNTTPVITNPVATNLIAGNYTATVTDAQGCVATANTTITEPAQLVASVSATNVKCFNGNDGTALVTAAGGTSPYVYNWSSSPVQTTALATNLMAGTYTATVTDNNGCVASATILITHPTQLAVAINKINASCFGYNDGQAIAVASGATKPYTYSWNTIPTQNTDTAKNLLAGIYNVTVTDSNGCVITGSTSIGEPSKLTYTVSKTDVNCFGESNGSATVSLSGGTVSYSYGWLTTPMQTSATATNLPAGAYTVLLKDAMNCEDSAIVTINEPPLLTAVTSNTDVKCFGGSDATASVIPSGGVAPYSYSWNTSPGQTATTATNLAIGAYSVTITDAHGCQTIAVTDTITQPTMLEVTTLGDKKTCLGVGGGSAIAAAKGGVAPYTYSWNTVPAQNGNNATGLFAGTYVVTVTDSNGCNQSANVTVDAFPSPEVDAGQDEKICLGTSVPIKPAGAKWYYWSPSTGLSCDKCPNPYAFPLETTLYTVIGYDTNQCTDTDVIKITVVPRVDVSVGPGEINVCIGDSAQLSAYGGASYTWIPGTGLSDSTSPLPVAYTDTSMRYTVIIEENECFTDTLYQEIKVHERPTIELGPDLKGIPGGTLQLNAVTTNTTDIRWEPESGLSCNNCENPIATLSKTITYTATANSGVCEVKDNVTIKVACDDQLFFMPNTFTPNGDGENDRFWPIAQGVHIVNHFAIYSRWGEVLYEAKNIPPNDPSYGWDGKYKQTDVLPGVFVYYLETRCGNGERIFIKGDISVIR